MNWLPEEVLEQVFRRLTSHGDRNSVSVVCKCWYEVERLSRERVLIPNCDAITPRRLLSRFPKVNSVALKGNPHLARHCHPWAQAMANASINLQHLSLKRMTVSDDTLHLISTSFPSFTSLVMIICHGFTTLGLASIASNSRLLRELDLQECKIDDDRGQWLSQFPDTCTTLTCLNFACLKGQVSVPALERLVARCPSLTTLKVNHSVPLESLNRILNLAPRLLHLGTESFIRPPRAKFESYCNFVKCTSLRSLSGFLRVTPGSLIHIYPLSLHLTSLNLSCESAIHTYELVNLIRYCVNVQRLWILDTLGDKGLGVVASTCKQLQELRVFPSGGHQVTEEGLVAVSAGCPKLNSILYYCHRMTNAALITVAKNCPNFVRFRLCTINPTASDAVTQLPLDEGYGAIVQSCKGLKRLSISGHLTDQVFLYIGMYAEQLEMLSIAFAGESDKGMLYVLNGCKKLKKLDMRNSPFGDMALLADVDKYETMRSLWMSWCQVSLGACRTLARKMPRINVEIINGEAADDMLKVSNMYLYRSLAGNGT